MSGICLNMIVRNETKIICRLLESVLPIIQYYCICDTEIDDENKLTYPTVQSFFECIKDITGTVHQFEFKNFQYARNKALEHAIADFPQAKYYLLLDADMILELIDKKKFLSMLERDNDDVGGWFFFQGSGSMYYKNIRMITKSAFKNECKYVGWTHEYIQECGHKYKFLCFPKNIIYINDVGDGGCKSNKYERDVKYLKSYLKSDECKNIGRQYYFLGISYYNLGLYIKAIKYFQLAVDFDAYEKWHSLYMKGQCYVKTDDNTNAIKTFHSCTSIDSQRIENLYQIFIITHDIEVYKKALPVLFNYKTDFWSHYLFVELDIYEYLFIETALPYITSFSIEFVIFNLFRCNEKYKNLLTTINNKCKFRTLRKLNKKQMKKQHKHIKNNMLSISPKLFCISDKKIYVFIKNAHGILTYSKPYLSGSPPDAKIYKIKYITI